MTGSLRWLIAGFGGVVRRLALVLVALMTCAAASAGTGLFEADSPLSMVLEAPWESILRHRDERPSAEGRLLLDEPTGSGSVLDVRIKVRGRWRLENCSRPPLTLRFDDRQLLATPLAGHAVVHLTPQCRMGDRFEQFLAREWTIFRAYGLLTAVSLRTRLATVELRDPENPRKSWIGYAILVEDIGLAADRLGLEWIEASSVSHGRPDPEATALFTLFQYMIGHTDWSLIDGPEDERCCHNAAHLASPGSTSGLIPLPYDFDASGLVDSGAIEPSSQLPITSVRQRLYRGFCIHNANVPDAVEKMERARPAFERLIEQSALLSPKSRLNARHFLEDFYAIVEDPEKLESRVIARCRG